MVHFFPLKKHSKPHKNGILFLNGFHRREKLSNYSNLVLLKKIPIHFTINYLLHFLLYLSANFSAFFCENREFFINIYKHPIPIFMRRQTDITPYKSYGNT